MRTLLITLSVLGLVGAAAWQLGALAPLMPALRGATSAVLGAPKGGPAQSTAPSGPNSPASPNGPRKCVAGERVLYTDTACPPGYTSTTVQGNLTVVAPVVPASVPTAKPAPGTAAEGTLRDQMIDRAVNR